MHSDDLTDLTTHFPFFLFCFVLFCDCSGNINKEGVKEYSSLLEKYLLTNKENENYCSIDAVIESQHGTLKLGNSNEEKSDGRTYTLRYKIPNPDEKNSCISSYYRCVNDSIINIKELSKMQLFVHILSAPCFAQLRTKEQLGYIVWSTLANLDSNWFIRILVQSVTHDPLSLDERIELFLDDFGTNWLCKTFQKDENDLEGNDAFKSNIKGLVNNLLEKAKSISQLYSRYRGEISSLRYDFNRRELLAKEIEKLTIDDILKFYKKFVASENNCKICVQSFGKSHEIPKIDEKEKEKGKGKGVVFTSDDVGKLRKECGYFDFAYKKK